MLITRKSILTGIERTIDLPITIDQISACMCHGVPLHKAFPNLTPDELEFMNTGVIPEEWENITTKTCKLNENE